MIAAATRPFAFAGAALLGAGVIATAPVVAPMAPAFPQLNVTKVALKASILDILTFPVWQQAIANEVEFVAIRAAGLAESGVGLAESAAQLPGTVITAIGQVFTGNALDALTTVEDWSLAAAEAIFVPAISANIAVGQIQLAIQSALLPAEPLALVSVGTGLFQAADAINRAIIVAVQNLVDAVVSLNPVNIVQALVGGVTGVLGSVVTGGQAVVDGIAGAQSLLVDALAARPAPLVEPAAAVPAAAVIAERPEATAATATVAHTEPGTAALRASTARAQRVAHDAVATPGPALEQRDAAQQDSAAAAPAKSAAGRRGAR